MISQSTEETAWATTTAARLRMVQASFADDDAAQREAYLAEELEGALRDIPTARKPGYLRELQVRFSPPQEKHAEPSVASRAAPEPSFPDLIDKLADLSPDDLAKLKARMEEIGVITSGAPAGALSADLLPDDAQKKFPCPPDQVLDPERTVKLLAVLLEFMFSVDQLVWSLWKTLAPNSVVRREIKSTDYRQAIANYLTGDSEVSTSEVSQTADKTRQLTAALIAGIGATGETFARSYLSRFSPIVIKQAADDEPGLLSTPERKCWRKYVELFDEVSGAKIETEIANAISQYAEQLILGKKPN